MSISGIFEAAEDFDGLCGHVLEAEERKTNFNEYEFVGFGLRSDDSRDRMEEAGLVRRVRSEHDRRSILVVLTDKGTETMEHARRHHRDGIQRHFSQHLTNADIKALTRALEKISTHARPLRPGRIRG